MRRRVRGDEARPGLREGVTSKDDVRQRHVVRLSAIWLADAARAAGGRVVTMELQDYKSKYAREMSAKAGLAGLVDFKVGDAVEMIGELPRGIDFVLVDLWKEATRAVGSTLAGRFSWTHALRSCVLA